ncbi:major facilitator transporter [Microbacterium mangrovi]|uniref:Major facilitator transporter n=1 Tax=Microbacterium mangrovi TaxID=1348253 RepID=A0A0B2A529_9MICO|nr:MFS transporter [Microbacterium mangrovi]KHK96859.1 major facilitator transporter [Microbacterium mangrovi]
MTAPEATGEHSASIWSPRFLWVTLGSTALVFLAAIESLAVTTVMPVISTELNGAALYAAAFSGTLATSVIGMVAAGVLSDRMNPLVPLTASVVLFVAGLLVAGFAPSMLVLVIGRLLQGFGVGGQVVTLYVVVARVYPSLLHGRLFAVFAAAWIVPSFVGPFAAGLVAQSVGWRWVFLGVAGLTAAAYVAVVIPLRGLDLHPSAEDAAAARAASAGGRLWCAVGVAAGALGLTLAGETRDVAPWLPAVVAAVALAVVLLTALPLLPRGTLRARRGLPSVVLMRAVIAGALFGSEVYIPYLLVDVYGFDPAWAGLALTASAITWWAASEVQGRVGERLGSTRIAVYGSTGLAVATAAATATALWHLPPAVLITGWAFAGAGMGLMYPRLSVLTLRYSTPQNQGFNSSALSIFDAVGSSSATAIMGILFTALPAVVGFPAVFALALALALFAFVPGLRLVTEGAVADR